RCAAGVGLDRAARRDAGAHQQPKTCETRQAGRRAGSQGRGALPARPAWRRGRRSPTAHDDPRASGWRARLRPRLRLRQPRHPGDRALTTFVALPGNEALAHRLAEITGGRAGRLATRRFPDGESYVRILDPLDGEDVHLVCTLTDPDAKVLPLVLAAGAARDGGARSVRLIAPYLAYMRQDQAFAPGEAVSARHFAALLSGVF